MIRRMIRRMFRLALVIGAAAAVYKVVQARKPSPALPEGDGWPPTPRPVPKPPDKAQAAPVAASPAPTAQKAAPKPTTGDVWVEPVNGACPATHPLKAKMTSLIYHLPGMTAYARTSPDRCYRDEEAAQADGLRKAKR